jgi:hypothetical protein
MSKGLFREIFLWFIQPYRIFALAFSSMVKSNRLRRRSRRAQQQASARPGRSVRSILHSGPNPIMYAQPKTKVEKFRLSVSGTISSTGGGNVEFSLPIDPTLSGEFGVLSNLYGEFRVMGGLFILAPTQALVTSSSSRSNSLAVIVYDNDFIFPPGAYSDLAAYATRDEFNTQNVVATPFRYGYTVPTVGGNTAIPWLTTTSYSPTSSLMIFASGLTPSLTYFTYIHDVYCEFRTRY